MRDQPEEPKFALWDNVEPKTPADAIPGEKRDLVVKDSEPVLEFETDRPREWEGEYGRTLFFDVLVYEGRIKKRETGEETKIKTKTKAALAVSETSMILLGTLKKIEEDFGALSKAGKIKIEKIRSKSSRRRYHIARRVD